MQTRTHSRSNIHTDMDPGMTVAGAMVTLLHNSSILPHADCFIDLVLENREARRILSTLGYQSMHWAKTTNGYSLAGHSLSRNGRRFELTFPGGRVVDLGTRATFDDAEAAILAA